MKLLLFIGIQCIPVAVIFSYLYVKDKDLRYSQGMTESALFCIPENFQADIVFMGSSHARMFSRNNYHDTLEKFLQKKIINIGISAGGIIPEKIYLDYFYSKNNQAPLIIYFIDPFVLASKKWNQDLYFLTEEPFYPGFFFQILFSDVNADVKFNYIKSKFKEKWSKEHGSVMPETTDSIMHIDTSAVRQRIESMFPDGFNRNTYSIYEKEFFSLAETVKEHKAKMIFIIPPTLLGEIPFTQELLLSLEKIKSNYNFPYYDYSRVIENPLLYYNHDHLNVRGIQYFTKEYLKKILAETN